MKGGESWRRLSFYEWHWERIVVEGLLKEQSYSYEKKGG